MSAESDALRGRLSEAERTAEEQERRGDQLDREKLRLEQTLAQAETSILHLQSERSASIAAWETMRKDIARWRREVAPQELLETHEVEEQAREAFAAAIKAWEAADD